MLRAMLSPHFIWVPDARPPSAWGKEHGAWGCGQKAAHPAIRKKKQEYRNFFKSYLVCHEFTFGLSPLSVCLVPGTFIYQICGHR
jgi:hypothetical protein